MSADAASAVLFMFAIHCGFVYAVVRLCLTREVPPKPWVRGSHELPPTPYDIAARQREGHDL